MSQKKLIEELLRLLSTGEELNETQKKEMEDYKFWKTQPVPRLNEKVVTEGPIESGKTPDQVPNDPYPLLLEFEWDTMDIEHSDQLQEVYDLLYEHYVEDSDATFRFQYLREFFNWALKAPGWRKDWHVGVRVKALKKLVAFISATPLNLKLTKTNHEISSVEINFLCIHKKLRSKRLAPVLIKEITRRVNKQNIWQALYTVGLVLPSPVTTCRYAHRPINWLKLYEVGFSLLPTGKTKASMTAKYALPLETVLKGLRPMMKKDLDQVLDLLTRFQERFDLIQTFTKEELDHWVLDLTTDKLEIVKSFVVEDSDGKIVDFMSYYLLPFTVLENQQHKQLNIAYLYYYASESAFTKDLEGYKKHLLVLINDALILLKRDDVDCFNCVTAQDNPYFADECKFGGGDGYLNYYLFNYKTFPIHGGIDPTTKAITTDKASGVGVILM